MHDISALCVLIFFFFNDTATTEIYTLSLHDALPISHVCDQYVLLPSGASMGDGYGPMLVAKRRFTKDEIVRKKIRSEEHTSELQSRLHLVCRLLLEKKKIIHGALPTYLLMAIGQDMS